MAKIKQVKINKANKANKAKAQATPVEQAPKALPATRMSDDVIPNKVNK